jgi:hypothetical protein
MNNDDFDEDTVGLMLDEDEFLNELSQTVSPISEAVGDSENCAVLTLGVRYIDGDDATPDTVQTYVSAAGYYGIIAEGLFHQLQQQIEDDDRALFIVLRKVIRDLEEHFEIDPDESLVEDDPESVVLH